LVKGSSYQEPEDAQERFKSMIDSLSDVLEAKGLTTQEEWEKKIKENLNAK
jgi:hypothetical protein